MARSVAELLPRPFVELTVEDVGEIIETLGDERETLFFERKAAISTNALAKACSAFANTMGGLLVVGVADEDDALAGMEPVASEAQLWVKDALRNMVIPMPPFRARWLPTEDDRGLLLVLVEESSTTPHLLTRSGAIYVRNPGSSDPVPISDQRRLLDLTARGERAEAAAVAATQEARAHQLVTSIVPIQTVAVAATGIPSGFEADVFAPETTERLSVAAWGGLSNVQNDYRRPVWRQHYVGVERLQRTNFWPMTGDLVSGALVTRSGAVSIYRGYTVPQSATEDEWRRDAILESELRSEFEEALRAARNILLDYGAHGAARFTYRLVPDGRRLFFNSRSSGGGEELPAQIVVDLWTTLDDEPLTDLVFNEIARAAALGPT